MIDTHAHLDNLDIKVIENLKKDGLELVINAGTCIKTSAAGMALSEKYAHVYFTVGFHPGYIGGEDGEKLEFSNNTLKELEKLAKHKKCVAIGEVGLDYHYVELEIASEKLSAGEGNKIKKEQERVFLEQIILADKLKLPLMLHVRDAHLECEKVLKENINYLNSGVIFHCYAGDLEFTGRMLKLFENKQSPVFFSFGGVITFKKAKEERAAVIRLIPKEQILTETDCPYLTPEPLRGKCDNEPKYIKYVYEQLASVWRVDFDEAEKQIKKNTRSAFYMLEYNN